MDALWRAPRRSRSRSVRSAPATSSASSRSSAAWTGDTPARGEVGAAMVALGERHGFVAVDAGRSDPVPAQRGARSATPLRCPARRGGRACAHQLLALDVVDAVLADRARRRAVRAGDAGGGARRRSTRRCGSRPRPAATSTPPRRCASAASCAPALGDSEAAAADLRAQALAVGRNAGGRAVRRRAAGVPGAHEARRRARPRPDARRIAILGGGMAGLTAAWQLEPASWATDAEITVYQRGWRLGGKGASSRGVARAHRGARAARLARLLRQRVPR